MARTTSRFRYFPPFVGHQPYIQELSEAAEPGGVDAIFVPTIDDGERLVAAAELAAKLNCPLVVLGSGAATPESIGERLAHIEGLSLAVIPVPPDYEHPMLSLASDDHPFGKIRSVGDLSLKRNLAVCIGRMLGLRSMLLLDDDMSGGTPELIRQAAGHLKSGMTAVGFAGAGFPDHSSVEHAAALTHREPLYRMMRPSIQGRGRRKVAVSGNSLLIDPSRFDEPFLTFYNEDWLATLPALLRHKVGVLGEMVQLPYEPFNGKRPMTQEPGEILTQGLFDLARSGKALGDADIAFWEGQLRDRKIRLSQLHRDLNNLDPAEFAVVDRELLVAELRGLDAVNPETQRLRDELAELNRFLLAREDSPEGAELRRKAIETIELAQQAHANLTAHDLHRAARLWREDQKRFAERLDSLPIATWQQAMDFFGLEAVWPYSAGPMGGLGQQPTKSTPTSAPHVIPRTKPAVARTEFSIDLPDGRHRISGEKLGDPSSSAAVVLLLHGLGGAPDLLPFRDWTDQLRHDRRDLLVLSPSLYHEERDLARSSRDCTMATSIGDLEHLLANLPELNSNLPLIAVGHGLGGLMATALPPHRLNGLVLVNPSHPDDGLFNQESPHLAIPSDGKYLRMKFGVGGIEVPERMREEYRSWPLRERLSALAANAPVHILASSDKQRFARDYERRSPGSQLTILRGSDRGVGSPLTTQAVVRAIAEAADRVIAPSKLVEDDQDFPTRGLVPSQRTATPRRRNPPPRPVPRRRRIGG